MQMVDFKDKHKGDRCFVVGNAPSLDRLDLSKLAGEITFGVNRIWMHPTLKPTYYCAEAAALFKDNADKVLAYDVPQVKFISARGKRFFGSRDPKIVYFDIRRMSTPGGDPDFSLHCHPVYDGKNVICATIQVAHYLGFDKIYLIGVDFDYGKGFAPVKHFYDDEITKKEARDASDLEFTGIWYRNADKVLNNGIEPRLLNATAGGQLEILPRIPFGELFK